MKKSVFLTGLSLAVGLIIGGTSVSANTVTVQAGDTVAEIASQNGTTVQQIVNQNNLQNPNLIYVGDKIVIPGGNSTVASQTTATVQQSQQSTKSSDQGSYQPVSSTSGTLSPSEKQAVVNQMEQRTGVSASEWSSIIYRESRDQVHASNPSSTATGLFQTLVGGEGDVQSQIDNAVNLYHAQGMQAWALTN
ncbi:transglycosylase [Lactobacillus phage Lenus]|uniref:Putative transglycosylase IsaA n=1 Tax=Lactobacillus phage Lenus TaxID=2053682 RepID=A0A2H4PB86_9CAUD|nr:transglycosylase [Lactobacillus phage Lenus]ATW59495.1 putative transglycosylase IsaA precursor [Lactobacillus phage Lenus]